jgi:phthalate 4,5-dioxygenase oxygenase subunit
MLSPGDNERLTRVGPQSAAGGLLRRFWYPVLQADRLIAGGAPQRVRLLSEDFVAFRTPDGRLGFVEESCPHRRASLVLARNETCGLRCLFHGWTVDVDGHVVDAPSEPAERSGFAAKVRTRSLGVRECAGLIWAFVGTGPEPQFPAFAFTALPRERLQFAQVHGPCNWVQLLEGQIDSAHISHLHQSAVTRTGGMNRLSLTDRAPRFDVETTPWGLQAAAIRSLGGDERYTRVTAFVMPAWEFIPRPIMPQTPDYEHAARFVVCQVPVDDENTSVWYISWHPDRAIERGEPSVMWPVWNDRYETVRDERMWGQDRAKMADGHFTGLDNLLTEDMAVAESMGPIADRSREYLGSSDTAVARFRRIFLDAIRDHEAGRTPLGCSGDVPYADIAAQGILHDERTDWRERATHQPA